MDTTRSVAVNHNAINLKSDRLLLTTHFSPNTHKYRKVTLCAYYENKKFQFGASFCSKKDQFIKKKGRRIASNRAYIHPYKIIDFPNEMTKRELLDFLYVESYRISNNTKYYLHLQCKPELSGAI